MMNPTFFGDACAVGELRHVARRHGVARLESAGDLDQITYRLAGGDEAFFGGVVALDQEHASGTRHIGERCRLA